MIVFRGRPEEINSVSDEWMMSQKALWNRGIIFKMFELPIKHNPVNYAMNWRMTFLKEYKWQDC